ncbi:hypothetical protein TH61_06910 [Rufibacter sp. DG15C]|uniref:alkaline phosphatase D family protein n=1 Tax=Rufibacter sp. DG15C TaxID=1379909 RepID=UPI00078D0B1C|nr:alkaline phosphatase D family protein [Rufibacter sp. DG15C]AMM50964.1 hypothetical protein TH61_06910 [Rufibacter sp. DG15C]
MSLTSFISFTLLGLSSLLASHEADEVKKAKETVKRPLTTIAFGSCNKEELPQPLWADILDNKPQVWIWLGGNVSEPSGDSEPLHAKYARLLAEPGYNALCEAASIIGTWNYNLDGPNSSSQEDTKRLFLDFVGEPTESLRRQQDLVYSAYTYGPKNKQVKIILLDTRAQAEPVTSKGQAKKKSTEADLLGEAQWEWLEKELKQNSAQLTLIGNSTQIIPEEHSFTKWANHPQARERFLKLLARTNSKGVVLLSGERRMAEISQLAVKGWNQPLYEVTSSGLTLSHKNKPVTEVNKHRVGTAVAKRNFGLIQIDWANRQARLQVQGDRNETLLSQNISF